MVALESDGVKTTLTPASLQSLLISDLRVLGFLVVRLLITLKFSLNSFSSYCGNSLVMVLISPCLNHAATAAFSLVKANEILNAAFGSLLNHRDFHPSIEATPK